MRRADFASLLAVVPCVVLLGACAGTDLKPIASFGASNYISPSGYSETKISDTQYQVKAVGTEATPKARIEKIARARAAQIGIEDKLKFYKVTNVQFAVVCSKKHEFYKGGAIQPGSRQSVLIDVLYAKDRVDPTYMSVQESFDALNTEISNEVIPVEDKTVAEQEARTACGQAT